MNSGGEGSIDNNPQVGGQGMDEGTGGGTGATGATGGGGGTSTGAGAGSAGEDNTLTEPIVIGSSGGGSTSDVSATTGSKGDEGTNSDASGAQNGLTNPGGALGGGMETGSDAGLGDMGSGGMGATGATGAFNGLTAPDGSFGGAGGETTIDADSSGFGNGDVVAEGMNDTDTDKTGDASGVISVGGG